MTGRYRRKGTKENTTRMGGDFLEEGTDRKGSPALANVTKSQIKDVLHPSRNLNRSISEIININDYLFSRKKGTSSLFLKETWKFQYAFSRHELLPRAGSYTDVDDENPDEIYKTIKF